MRRPTAAVGSALFFVLAPGVVVGLIPWLLTRWQAHESLPYYWGPVRVIGMLLLLAGLIVLVVAYSSRASRPRMNAWPTMAASIATYMGLRT